MTTNLIPDSPVALGPCDWSALPEVNGAARRAFGQGGVLIEAHGHWFGFARSTARDGCYVFAYFDGHRRRDTAAQFPTASGSSLAVIDPEGTSAWMVGGADDEQVIRVDLASGAAIGVDQLDPASKARWRGVTPLRGGGFAGLLHDGDTTRLCVYDAPDPAVPTLWRPRARHTLGGLDARELCALPVRRAPGDVTVLVLTSWTGFEVLAYRSSDGRLVRLAAFPIEAMLSLAIDESGEIASLPGGDPPIMSVNFEARPLTGLPQAMSRLSALPEYVKDMDAAPPDLTPFEIPGADRFVEAAVMPTAPRTGEPRPTGLVASLYAAMTRGSRRAQPDAAMQRLADADTPEDIYALIHAWTWYQPSFPDLYDLWLDSPPTGLDSSSGFLEGHACGYQLGIFAHGAPIIARYHSKYDCEIAVFDEEGVDTYSSFDDFLREQQMQCQINDNTFDL